MRAEQRAVMVIEASRALSLAAAVVVVAGTVHAVTAGREPIPVLASAFVLLGTALVLTSVLRERGTVRRSAGITVALVVAFAAWGLLQPTRGADVLAVMTRVVGFALLGEGYLWRVLSIARGTPRWREVRSDALLALGLVIAAALVPGPIDRDPLPALALLVACVGAVALSLARSIEELTLSSGLVHGRTAGGSATGTAFALGILALAVGAALPWIQAAVGAFVRSAAPLLGDLVFTLLLPLGYVAAYLVYLVQFLRELIKPVGIRIDVPRSPFDPSGDAERLRELEQARPFVFGALEVIVAVVAIAIAAALIARLVQDRRDAVPEGVSLDRERVDGIGMRATLRGLFPRRAPGRHAPADDGSPASAIRRAYWRLLEVAEREGPGWRGPAETPAEHGARLLVTGERWAPSAAIVRAFEALRYGERDPDGPEVARVRDALRGVEAAR